MILSRISRSLIWAAATVVALCALCSAAPSGAPDTAGKKWGWADSLARAMVSQMTLEEKVSLLRATSPGVPRLGVGRYYHGNEALHGVVRPGEFTVFPQAIAFGASWNPALVERIAGAISDEARAKWNALGHGSAQTERHSDLLTFWSPTVNMARDPRWGRTPETYGEDPFLTGRIGVGFVRGLQGNDAHYLKVVSTPKHFAANNEEHDRMECNARISEKDLREYYLPAFEALVREADAQGIMTAYNAINGIPCTVNAALLDDILCKEWGFDGYIVSDCGAPWFVVHAHHYVDTPEESASLAIRAGLDLECGDNIYVQPLLESCRRGWVSGDDIDRAAFRVLRARIRLGDVGATFPNPYDTLSKAVIACPWHQALALEAARQGAVLLKNDGILPLDATALKRITVVGSNADKCIFGDYSGEPVIEPVSVLEGLRRRLSRHPDITLTHIPWGEDPDAETLAASDVVIAVMGTDMEVERETLDRTEISLPNEQKAFLRKVYAMNRKVVLVLLAGSSLSLEWEDAHLPAILDMWYPGESGGTAAAEILFGDVNPAGRLPLTFYRSMEDLPAFDDYSLAPHGASPGRTYQHFRGEVLYPFGHGLSYSHFDYSHLQVRMGADSLRVSFRVRNTSRRDGDEVVQLYLRCNEEVSQPASIRPLRQLKAFKRIPIPARRTVSVTLSVPLTQLRFWEDGAFRCPAGPWTVEVGTSSRNIRLRQQCLIRSSENGSDFAIGDKR